MILQEKDPNLRDPTQILTHQKITTNDILAIYFLNNHQVPIDNLLVFVLLYFKQYTGEKVKLNLPKDFEWSPELALAYEKKVERFESFIEANKGVPRNKSFFKNLPELFKEILNLMEDKLLDTIPFSPIEDTSELPVVNRCVDRYGGFHMSDLQYGYRKGIFVPLLSSNQYPKGVYSE